MQTTNQIIENFTNSQIQKCESPQLIHLCDKYQQIYCEETEKYVRKLISHNIFLERKILEPKNDLDQLIKDLRFRNAHILGQLRKDQYFFITVSFKDSLIDNLGNLPSIIEKKLDRVYVKDYIFNIECRGEKEGGSNLDFQGYHTHILLRTSKHRKKSEIMRDFYSTFNKFVGDKQKVDVKTATGSHLPRLNYILGHKKDVEKMEKVKIDHIFRKQYGLDNYYTSNKDFYRV